MCVWKEQGIAMEPLPTTHDAEGERSCTCRERSKTGSSLEASERQHVCSGICVERRWHIIFKTLSTELEALRMERTIWRDVSVKNFIEYSNIKGTYLLE